MGNTVQVQVLPGAPKKEKSRSFPSCFTDASRRSSIPVSASGAILLSAVPASVNSPRGRLRNSSWINGTRRLAGGQIRPASRMTMYAACLGPSDFDAASGLGAEVRDLFDRLFADGITRATVGRALTNQLRDSHGIGIRFCDQECNNGQNDRCADSSENDDDTEAEPTWANVLRGAPHMEGRNRSQVAGASFIVR